MNIDNDKIAGKLDQIAGCIYESIGKMHQHTNGAQGLFAGEFGILLFMYYYSKFSNDKKILDSTYSYTDTLIENMGVIIGNLDQQRGNDYFSYSNGLSGILYLLEFLNEKKFIECDFSDLDETFEHFLTIAMKRCVKDNNYDFLHGALGIGFYFLKNNKYQLVEELIDDLYRSAIIEESGKIFRWNMKFNHLNDFDISLSHGISSIIIFLARAIKNNISVEKSTKMLTGAITYILSLELNFQLTGSHFPTDSKLCKSRLAWCYGDLGIASSIGYAGKIANNEAWKNKAMEVFIDSTKRLSLSENFVDNAGICHGSAGIALIFKRMYIETGNDLFLKAAGEWINQTLDFSKYDDGLAGYKSKWYGELIRNFSLLNGVSGIGLTFLSFLTSDLQDWDELFLLS